MRHGYVLSNAPESDWLICINHNEVIYQDFIFAGGSADRAILLRDEPMSIFPSQFESRVEKLYSLVLTPGMTRELSGMDTFIPWPYESNANPNVPKKTDVDILQQVLSKSFPISQEVWNSRENEIVLISSNKVSPKKSLFHEFRRLVAHNAQTYNILVYGELWDANLKRKVVHRLAVLLFAIRNRSSVSIRSVYGNLHWKYKTYGAVDNKFDVLVRCKISIVLENSDTTISEKLFDSILAGCVPIYIGPKLSSVELPDNIALECEPKIDSLFLLLDSLSSEQLEHVRLKGQDFIQSDCFKHVWSSAAVNSSLSNLIRDHLERLEDQD
jgi:hypothetical protein